jgi:hypothetical protein
MLEQAIHELIEARAKVRRPLEVVVAAGNSLLSRCHARIRLKPKETRTLDWRILPDDGTPSFMEIWPVKGKAGATPDLVVELTTPSGDKSPPVRGGEVYTWRPTDAGVLSAIVRLARPATSGNEREMILLAVAPTQRLDRGEKVAPCGTWLVRLTNHGRARVDIEAYIERDETPHGFPRRGRQSRFDDPNYERFDKFGRLKEDDAPEDPKSRAPKRYVKRAGTINSIATGEHTVVIAGFRGSDRATAKYSSSGPDIAAAAVSEDSITCHGVLAAGSRSGSRVAMNGTSVAAPQLTRELAKRLVSDPTPPSVDRRPYGRKIVEAVAKSKEDIAADMKVRALGGAPVPKPGPPPPAERYGKGRLDARLVRAAIRRRIGDPAQ